MKRTTERSRFGLPAYGLLAVVLLMAVALSVYLLPVLAGEPLTWLTFLALLPLLNAVFDFVSFGLTRWLLRLGATHAGFVAVGTAAADLLGAAVLFVLLGVALVSYVHWLNVIGAGTLLDLGELFRDIRAEPEAYWWLYVTFFSTLLPTLAHLIVGSFSGILALMPERLADFIRAQLPHVEADAWAKHRALWALTTIGFVAIAFVLHVCWGIALAVIHFHPQIGWTYLWLFERYAAWVGAPVVPGPAWWSG